MVEGNKKEVGIKFKGEKKRDVGVAAVPVVFVIGLISFFLKEHLYVQAKKAVDAYAKFNVFYVNKIHSILKLARTY